MENYGSNSNYGYGYGYNGGNRPPFYNFFTPKDPLLNSDAKHLTKLSILAGAGVLSFTLVQYLMSFILSKSGLYELYTSNYSFQKIFTVLISIIGVFLPFRIIYAFYDKKDKDVCFELGKPISKKAFWLAAAAGLMVCCAGDFVTAGFSGFVTSFGIEFTKYDTEAPSTISETMLFVLECAVVPALVEEFAVRGVIMQPLRRYGDRFALLMSSLIFALMHGNMVQIPFAFVAGIALGYFAMSTGSLWTSIAIHFANNLFAVITTVINEKTSFGGIFYYAAMLAIFVGGIFAMIEYIKTEHTGLGLTFVPNSDRNLLLAASAVFLFISFVYSAYDVARPLTYIVTFIVLAISFVRYNRVNRKALGNVPVSSLSKKMRLSLYFATPTVIISVFLLTMFTMKSVTIKSYGGYFFCYAALISLLAIAICALVCVLSSKELQNKGVYQCSLAILTVICFIAMIASFASRITVGSSAFGGGFYG